MSQTIVYTIAGSDSSGGAGLQNDLQTFHHFGVHGCSIVSAVTAQNNRELRKITYLSAEAIAAQLNALQTEFAPQAIKIGMLGKAANLKLLGAYLNNYHGPVVLDPVLISTSGKNLFSGDLTRYLSQLREILSFVDLLTPNLFEAEKLVNRKLKTHQDLQEAAEEILALGVKSVLIKGGHFDSSPFCQDYWTDGQTSFWLSNARFPQRNYRGTGCALSAALTACLALGYEIKDAVVIARMYVNRGIRKASSLPDGSAFLYHDGWPEEELDLPYLFSQPQSEPSAAFPSFDSQPLGLYPIIDSLGWVEKLLPSGVKMLQLRIKNKQGAHLENEIQKSIALARNYQAKLFINDYWDLALRHGAYGVHLGQEDLNTADLASLRRAGLRLGISTHCYYEVARAHAFRPSYLACGPIFPTTSKLMPFAPQGLSRLKRWRRTLNYPLVAIGGINLERLPEVLATKVDGIALISAITQAGDPIQATQELLAMVEQNDPQQA